MRVILLLVLGAAALAVVAWAAFAFGPLGLRAEYRARAARALAGLGPAGPAVTEADLAPLPAPVQRYLRLVGVVGHPRPGAFQVRFAGRFRSGPDQPWMPMRGEQTTLLDPPTRLFFMTATRAGIPLDGLHAYDPSGAGMRVRLLSAFPVVDARGPAFQRTETVTILNDLAIMAPAGLLDPAIRWRAIDDRSAEATLTVGPNTVRAVLVFAEDGRLVDFWSDDRPALAPDGKTLVPQRWSTPLGAYRAQGPFLLVSSGEARYAPPSGNYAYIQFDGLEVTYPSGR